MLCCLLRQHKCELFHAHFYSLLSIAPVYHTMSVHSITFLVYQPFELEGVMAVSKGIKAWSSEKIVLLVDADRTTVVLAQEPAPPHITQTLADCTPTQLDKEPATPLRTPSQRLKQKKNCSQVRFRSYGSYYFALASLYLLIPTNFKFEGCN